MRQTEINKMQQLEIDKWYTLKERQLQLAFRLCRDNGYEKLLKNDFDKVLSNDKLNQEYLHEWVTVLECMDLLGIESDNRKINRITDEYISELENYILS